MKTRKKKQLIDIKQNTSGSNEQIGFKQECKKYGFEDYHDYIELIMEKSRINDFESHILTCDACINGLKRAVELDREVKKSTSDAEIGRHMKSIRERLDRFFS